MEAEINVALSQGAPAATSSWNGASVRGMALPTPRFQTCNLQTSETIKLYGFKPPNYGNLL